MQSLKVVLGVILLVQERGSRLASSGPCEMRAGTEDERREVLTQFIAVFRSCSKSSTRRSLARAESYFFFLARIRRMERAKPPLPSRARYPRTHHASDPRAHRAEAATPRERQRERERERERETHALSVSLALKLKRKSIEPLTHSLKYQMMKISSEDRKRRE